MSSHADIILTRFSHALNSPIQTRCAELTVLIDRCSSKDLQNLFPTLMDNIFGTSGGVSWGIRNITQTNNAKDFEILHHFLGPLGPVFRLIYKILTDCNVKYEFSASFLPNKIRYTLEQARVPPFYTDLVNIDLQTKKLRSLSLNAFDYYMFHFAYHLTNPWQQRIQNTWSTWNTVYYVLSCDYMVHFLPTEINAAILPHLTHFTGKNPLVVAPQTITNRPYKRTNLLKPDVFLDQETSSDISSLHQSQQHPRAEIWRSETIVHVFIDIWLNNDQLINYVDSSFNYQSKVNDLPSGEYIRILRILVKQFHAFSASAKCDNSSLGELKKIVQPMLQGKMYIFLRHLVYRWPLDGSFRLVLELWLSFIQPWRYLPTEENSNIKNRDTDIDETQPVKKSSKGVEPGYREFIAENLICYTVILQQLIQRFSRIDLTSPKNSLMLFRVTKVFSQPNLVPIIQEIEKIVGSVNNSPTHSFTNNNFNNLPPISPSSWSGNINPNSSHAQNLNIPKTNTNIMNNTMNLSYMNNTLDTSSLHMTSGISDIISNIDEPDYTLDKSSRTSQNFSTDYYTLNSPKKPTGSQISHDFTDNVANSKLAAFVRHKMFELEGSDFYYRPMFHVYRVAPEIYHLLGCIQSAEGIANEIIKSRIQETSIHHVGITGFLRSIFYSEETNDEFSLEERKKVTCYLSFAKQNLVDIFRVHASGMNVTQLITPDITLNDSFIKSSMCFNTSLSQNSSKSNLDISPMSSKLRAKTIKYEGDPDLHPIRSYECAFLVRALYQLAQKINTKYYTDIQISYNRNDLVGKILRNILMPPSIVYSYDKSIPGMSQRVKKSLPPRISLRYFASNNFLIFLFLLVLFCYLIGYNPFIVVFILILCWSFFITIKSLLNIPTTNNTNNNVHNISNNRNISFHDTFNESF